AVLDPPSSPPRRSSDLSYYDYRPIGGGPAVRLPVRDVVHFRQDALDPDNPRKGLSKLRTLLREVWTDEEAANFSASILHNMGVRSEEHTSELQSRENLV